MSYTPKDINLHQRRFDIQMESINNLLDELSANYKLHRNLLHVEERNLLCVFYDGNFIGTVMQGMRQDKDRYFLDRVFTPTPNAAEICGIVNANVEYQKEMISRKPKSLDFGGVFDINSIPESFLTRKESQVK